MPNKTPPRDMVMLVDDSHDELGLLVDAFEQAGFTALARPAVMRLWGCSTGSCPIWSCSTR
jgi:hypothetical protein